MKKILLALLIILLSIGSAWSRDFEETKKLAEQGVPGAQVSLGIMYSQGKEVPQDYKKAVYWCTKAAEQGDSGAQWYLGLMYSDGEGIPQDYKKAVYWYPNPAMQGVSAKFTEGTISSLTGFQDDLRLYQISAPVQPGNSGGALVDENGNVLGVIVAMLDAKTTFRVSGSLPQNVNYAVKSIYAQAMLDTLSGVSNKLLAPSNRKANAVERVQNSTVMVLSYGP